MLKLWVHSTQRYAYKGNKYVECSGNPHKTAMVYPLWVLFLSAVTLLCVGVMEYAFPAFKEVFKNFNAELTGATSFVLKYHYLINLAIVILLPHFAYLVLLGMQKESSGLKMVYLFFVLFILFVLIVVVWFFFAIYSQYIPIYIMGTPI